VRGVPATVIIDTKMEGVTFWAIPKPKMRIEETKQCVKVCGRKNFTVVNVNKHPYYVASVLLKECPRGNFRFLCKNATL